MQVTIVVTHLLGVGHLARALTLGRAFAAAGHDVTVVSGGLPVPHLDRSGVTFVQLPALRSDGTDFTHLLTPQNSAADDAYKGARRADLIRAVQDSAPDVLITELFPFGRRNLKGEFEAMLDAVATLRPRPLVLASIRDILAPPSKPSKVAYSDQVIAAHYEGVLVHSDPDLVPLETSWPVSAALKPKLHYTGFVAPAAPVAPPHASGEILVSAGGGTIGDGMFRAACAAAAQDPEYMWRLLVSGDDARRSAFRAMAPDTAVIEPPRPDFRTLLAGAAASLSMCGYNTAMDLLQTGVPSVIVPFDSGQEVEQGLRADALSALPGIEVVRQSDLSAETLRAALRRVLAAERRPPQTAGMDGATRSVAIVQALVRGKAPSI